MSRIPVELVERLVRIREGSRIPSVVRTRARAFADHALGVLYPQYASEQRADADAVLADVERLRVALGELVEALEPAYPAPPGDTADRFVASLSTVVLSLEEDAQAIFEGDPAARSVDEVLLAYPGFFAIAVYRLAHALFTLGVPLVPRLLTEYAHEKTGVDFHPGARVGRRFCIDHGTGVVIGETTVIGDGVKLYQGVTLGALTVQKDLAGQKRHPTIEDGVVVYAGATILGGDTVVGRGSIVAGNAFVTASVPPDSIVGRNGEVRPRAGVSPEDADFVI